MSWCQQDQLIQVFGLADGLSYASEEGEFTQQPLLLDHSQFRF